MSSGEYQPSAGLSFLLRFYLDLGISRLLSFVFLSSRDCWNIFWYFSLLIATVWGCLPGSSALYPSPALGKCPKGKNDCRILAHLFVVPLSLGFVPSISGCLKNSVMPLSRCVYIFVLYPAILVVFSRSIVWSIKQLHYRENWMCAWKILNIQM